MIRPETYPGGGLRGQWRRLRSLFWERVVERSSSPWNPVLEVWYVRQRFELNTERVNYSWGSLHTVFAAAFHSLGIGAGTQGPVLLLGLGAGSVPHLLREKGALAPITAVEIDPEVVRLGKKWFGMDAVQGLKIEIADAVSWVAQAQGTWGLIIVDLFLEDLVPPAAEQAGFLRNLNRLLAPGGRLLYNRLRFTPALAARSEAFLRSMQEVLPGTRAIRADDNLMFVYEKPAV